MGRINKVGDGTAAIQHNNMTYDHTQLRWVGNEDEITTDHWDDPTFNEADTLSPPPNHIGAAPAQRTPTTDSTFQLDPRYVSKLRDSVASMNAGYSAAHGRQSPTLGRDPALLIRDFAVDALVAMAKHAHSSPVLPASKALPTGGMLSSLSPRAPTVAASPRNILPSRRSSVREEFKETEEDSDFADIDIDETKLKTTGPAGDATRSPSHLRGLLGSVTVDDDLEI